MVLGSPWFGAISGARPPWFEVLHGLGSLWFDALHCAGLSMMLVPPMAADPDVVGSRLICSNRRELATQAWPTADRIRVHTTRKMEP